MLTGVHERRHAVPRLVRRRRTADIGVRCRSSALSCWTVSRLDAPSDRSLYGAEATRARHRRRAGRLRRQVPRRLQRLAVMGQSSGAHFWDDGETQNCRKWPTRCNMIFAYVGFQRLYRHRPVMLSHFPVLHVYSDHRFTRVVERETSPLWGRALVMDPARPEIFRQWFCYAKTVPTPTENVSETSKLIVAL